jgi:hypothetical protein
LGKILAIFFFRQKDIATKYSLLKKKLHKKDAGPHGHRTTTLNKGT